MKRTILLLCALSLAGPVLLPAQSDETAPPKAAPPNPKDNKSGSGPESKLKSLPPDAHVDQSIELNGKTLRYTATVGTIPVKDDTGRTTAEVVFTSYIVPGKSATDRPITFALNGGPGAASVYLNLGAFGPKRVQFGAEGDSPSDSAVLKDNPGTWLDFTDLVFIDPVGTGFSQSMVNEAETRKYFYGARQDVEYLSRIIYDWLVRNGRLQSRKYLVGESYGGYRGPRITHYLQSQLGVAMNGVVLVSPYLEPSTRDGGDISPLPWMMTLPSITAANYERKDKLTAESMKEVISYTQGEYASDLLRGRSDPQSTERIVKRVTELTGLDPTFVKRAGGRLETQAYLREVFREQGKLGSRYDPNTTSWDAFPYDPEQRSNDPILESIIAPTTTAMVDFVTRIVGWKVDARYNALSSEVNRAWDRTGERKGAGEDLRFAVANDPKLRVLIAHGWNDLSCPFMASVLVVDQMPAMNDPNRVQVKEYPGGHMFYSRTASQAALRKDVEELYNHR